MPKRHHEIRDAVYVFIEFDGMEKQVIDSRPFQRLRHIHQLALSALVYPGASHKRFEHSLGVMEIAGRIFETVTRIDKLDDATKDVVPEAGSSEHGYWRSVLRMAALCHDIGHLPFSHAAEDDLLPEGVDHERITYDLIRSDEMAGVWGQMRPSPKPDDVAKLALGPTKVEKLHLDLSFDAWEGILAEMIVSDAFGADRIDYLLRDSTHTGVAYGRFDFNRLIQTLRILPSPQSGEDADGSREPGLGIERGGLESAEALLLARYFMFAQVYYHPTRLIYDEHLKDFLADWLPDGVFPSDPAGHLAFTDNEVWAAILAAARNSDEPGHEAARRIVERDHFRIVDERGPTDPPEAIPAIADALRAKFGPEHVRYGKSPNRGDAPDFSVRERDGEVGSSLSRSEVLRQLPASRDEYVFMPQNLRQEAKTWLADSRDEIVDRAISEDEEVEEGS